MPRPSTRAGGADAEQMQTQDKTHSRLEVVSVSRTDDVTTVVLAGDLDLAAAPATGRLLIKEVEEHPRKLAIDVSALEVLDSAGLSVFVRANRALTSNGGEPLILVGAPQPIRRLLEITGLSSLLAPEP